MVWLLTCKCKNFHSVQPHIYAIIDYVLSSVAIRHCSKHDRRNCTQEAHLPRLTRTRLYKRQLNTDRKRQRRSNAWIYWLKGGGSAS